MNCYTILISFWSIFAPGVDVESAARAMGEGKTLSEILDKNNEFVVLGIKKLLKAHHRVHIMVDPFTEAIPLGKITAYLKSVGIHPEDVWTAPAAELLAQDYDVVVDSSYNNCYHDVVVMDRNQDVDLCVEAWIEEDKIHELRTDVNRARAAQKQQQTLGSLVSLGAAF